MNQSTIVGHRKPPQTPQGFHAVCAQLDLEAKTLDHYRRRGFIVKFHAWADLERWESSCRLEEPTELPTTE
jgi:hypothetical protein